MGNLNVSITATVTDLQSKFAIARAETAALTSEMNRLAKASAAGIIDPAGAARLQQVTSDFVHAKTQVAALGNQLSVASAGVLGFSQRLAESHGSVSTATREFRALFDELSSGRTRQSPGTIAILLQRVAGLSPAALIATGGVLGLAGGIAYLAVKSIQAANELTRIKISAETAGNFDLVGAKIKGMTDELERSAGISGSAARKIAGDLASIPGMVGPAAEAGAALVARFMGAFGIQADKAGEELKKLLEPTVSAEQAANTLAKMGASITQSQRDAAAATDRTGNANQQLATKMQLIDEIAVRSRAHQLELASAATASARNFLVTVGEEEQGLNTTAELLQGNVSLWNSQSAAINKNLSALRAMPATPDQTISVGMKAADKENPLQKQLQDARTSVQEIQSGLTAAQAAGTTIQVDRLTAGLEKARENLSALQFGPVLEKMRADMAQLAASWDGTQSGLLTKQIQISQAALTNVQQSAKAQLEVKTEIARLEVEQRRTAAAEIIASTRAENAALAGDTNLSGLQRLEAERANLVKLLSNDRIVGNQRLEVAREFNQNYAAINREGAAQAAAIARQDAAADISISRMKIEAARTAINLTNAADAAAVAAKLARLRELTAQEFALDEQALENELSTLNVETAAYDAAYQKIRELKAKLVLDLGKLDKEAADATEKGLRQEVSQKRTAINEITGAESTLVSDLLNKRKSLSQSLLSIGAQLAQKEIQNDLTAFTQRILLTTEEQAADKSLASGGFLFHAAIEARKALATTQSQTAQTTAVIAGNSARTAAQTAAAVESKTVSATTGAAQVQADAAKAAAGAYSSVSAIPIVGAYLAPAAAAVAYAAVMSFESMASLDTGTNYVPQNMVAQLHQGEAVVPRQYNPAAGGSGAGGGGETHNHFNIVAWDGESVQNWLSQPSSRQMLADTMRTHFSRGGR